MAVLQPVTLTGELVTLSPLAGSDVDGLTAAAGDGRLWELWYTAVPTPEAMAGDVGARLARQAAGTALPFTVRRNDTGAVIGSTNYLNIEAEVPRLEIGGTWNAGSVQRSGINAESKLLLLGRRLRGARLPGRGVPHALAQRPVPDGDRPARREAGRRAAQPPAAARRLAAGHRRLLGHRRGVARRPPGTAVPARPRRVPDLRATRTLAPVSMLPTCR